MPTRRSNDWLRAAFSRHERYHAALDALALAKAELLQMTARLGDGGTPDGAVAAALRDAADVARRVTEACKPRPGAMFMDALTNRLRTGAAAIRAATAKVMETTTSETEGKLR